MSTSKRGPTLVCFVHFDLETCFALQRPLFHSYLNFQKWSETVNFLHVWLGNVLRATMARTLATSQLPKVVRRWCALYILTWKRASRHNCVHLFISHVARCLRTRRFSEPTSDPPEPQIIGINTVNCDCPTFSRTCIFFLLALSSLISLFFSSLTVPTSAFPSVHIVGSLTSKLPSISDIMLYTPIITLSNHFRKKRRKGPSGFPSRGSCPADSPSDRRRTAGRPVRWWPVAASPRSRRTRRPAGAPSPLESRYPLVMTNSLLLKMVIYSGFSHWTWWFSIVMLIYQRLGGFTTNTWEEVPSRSK